MLLRDRESGTNIHRHGGWGNEIAQELCTGAFYDGVAAKEWDRLKELERHGLLQSVDAAPFCVDVGWRKPARPIVEAVLEALAVIGPGDSLGAS